MSPLRSHRPASTPTSSPETEADRLALLHLIAARVGYQPALSSVDVPWSEVTASLPSLALAHGVATLAHESPAVHLAPQDARVKLEAIARREKLRGMWRLGAQSRVLPALERAGIPTLVLKGQALSVLAYGDWASRGAAADLDLLVAANDMARAEATLSELGFKPRGERRAPKSGGRLARYALWLHYERGWLSPELGSIDLHWRALPGGAEWNTGTNLLQRAVEVELPIGPVKTLGPVEALIVAGSQGESENWSRLKRLADLAAIQRLCTPQDIAQAAELSSLVAPSLEYQEARWNQLPLQPMGGRTAATKIANLWNMRAGSGSRWDAAVRSTLGALAPARKLSRAPETDQGPS